MKPYSGTYTTPYDTGTNIRAICIDGSVKFLSFSISQLLKTSIFLI